MHGRKGKQWEYDLRRAPMKVAVLGGGHGGLATAGHLSLKGNEVNLFSFYKQEIDAVVERGGIQLEGDVKGFTKVNLATTAIDEAIRGVNLIMVIMPALAHRNVASLLAGCMEDDQALLLSPARTGGALEVYSTFRRFQAKKRVLLGECQTFVYATESRGSAHVEIMKIKNRVRAAALPAVDNGPLIDLMSRIYPEYAPAVNVLETSINNTGAVVHPAPMLLNSGLLERASRGEDLRYYKDIITRFVCDEVMEKIDREKSMVVEAFGVPVLDIKQWYQECYDVKGESLYEVLQNNPYYLGFSAPKHVLGYHHVLDEIPNSLVPISEFGSVVGVGTPMIDAIVHLASAALGHDYWMEGRTLDKLGLENMSPSEILEFVNEGTRFWENT
jgi:opine dehydrogenase